MAWHQTANKPLFEQAVNQFTYTYNVVLLLRAQFSHKYS